MIAPEIDCSAADETIRKLLPFLSTPRPLMSFIGEGMENGQRIEAERKQAESLPEHIKAHVIREYYRKRGEKQRARNASRKDTKRLTELPTIP